MNWLARKWWLSTYREEISMYLLTVIRYLAQHEHILQNAIWNHLFNVHHICLSNHSNHKLHIKCNVSLKLIASNWKNHATGIKARYHYYFFIKTQKSIPSPNTFHKHQFERSIPIKATFPFQMHSRHMMANVFLGAWCKT